MAVGMGYRFPDFLFPVFYQVGRAQHERALAPQVFGGADADEGFAHSHFAHHVGALVCLDRVGHGLDGVSLAALRRPQHARQHRVAIVRWPVGGRVVAQDLFGYAVPVGLQPFAYLFDPVLGFVHIAGVPVLVVSVVPVQFVDVDVDYVAVPGAPRR